MISNEQTFFGGKPVNFRCLEFMANVTKSLPTGSTNLAFSKEIMDGTTIKREKIT